MTDYESSGQETSESVDEQRARSERFAMTVCDGAGGGYVNVGNLSYDDTGHTYSVEVRNGEAVGCSCPHATYRGAHCKHQIAVEQRPLVVSSATAQAHRVATDGGREPTTRCNECLNEWNEDEHGHKCPECGAHGHPRRSEPADFGGDEGGIDEL